MAKITQMPYKKIPLPNNQFVRLGIPDKAFQILFIPSNYYKVGWWNRKWYLVKPGLVADTTRVKDMHDALLYPCLQQDRSVVLAVVTRKKQFEMRNWFDSYQYVLSIALNEWIRVWTIKNEDYTGYYDHEVVNLKLAPVWPTWSYDEYLMKAFSNTYIDKRDDPLLTENTLAPERVIEESFS